MNIREKEALAYDDVLLVPQKSEILPNDVSLETKLTKNVTLRVPLISADMDTVTEAGMAIALAREGCAGIIHKNMTPERQAEEVARVKNEEEEYAACASIGVGDEALTRVEQIVEAGGNIAVISTAHGHSKGVLDTIKKVKEKFPGVDVIAGNVVTAEAVKELIDAGADAVKVGVGPGSICTTRIVAGVGVPQFSAVAECVLEASKYGIPIIADGGIRYSGDIVKALAAGAATVMAGGLFAGTDESPGERIEENGVAYKSYRGMGSSGALQSGSQDRYAQKGVEKKKLVPEGVEGRVKYKGSISDVVYQLVGGIKSGCGYLGAINLSELNKRAEFVKITSASIKESHPHDIFITKEASNYQGK
ncbi:IMP dehydrogenase [Patescibacteria group bacterium]|nr:IMP dehydrogenase [Patescibacteria group bacterium]